MIPKLIKTEKEYQAVLDRIEDLMDAKSGSPEADELDLLAVLVEFYENEVYPVDLPDPINAIKFRMEQANLSRQDLVPYIGSRSKVSEVLNGKRPLSLRMIRSLHEGLGIPAEVLLHKPGAEVPDDSPLGEWERYPVREMAERRWFKSFERKPAEATEYAEELLREFFASVSHEFLRPALLRQHVRSGSRMNDYAILAWRARLLMLAQHRSIGRYDQGTVSEGFMRQLVSLSYMDHGPRLAQEFLAKSGIVLVALTHLGQTHLDGAAFLAPAGNPIVGLTLRHDRLDNFWFTLCHELAHVALHVGNGEPATFYDDMDAEGKGLEAEADKFASEMLIPSGKWNSSEVRENPAPAKVRTFAGSLRIHPAIVAGRIRRKRKNYKMLSNLVGHREVRRQFSNLEGAVEEAPS